MKNNFVPNEEELVENDPRFQSYREARALSYKVTGWSIIIFFTAMLIYGLFAGR